GGAGRDDVADGVVRGFGERYRFAEARGIGAARIRRALSAMPEMTGSELAEKIRAIRPAIPIVLMSGFVTPALHARARTLGVAEVLTKPLVERDIARALAAAMAGTQEACALDA